MDGVVSRLHQGLNSGRDSQQVYWTRVYSLDREKVVVILGDNGKIVVPH